MERVIRIVGLELKNIRIFEDSKLEIPIDDYYNIRNIKGLFGENGSGKTTVIDVLQFLRDFVVGTSRYSAVYHYNMAHIDAEKASIKINFCVYECPDFNTDIHLIESDPIEHNLSYYIEFNNKRIFNERFIVEEEVVCSCDSIYEFHSTIFSENLNNEYVSLVHNFFGTKLFFIREEDIARGDANILHHGHHKINILDDLTLYTELKESLEEIFKGLNILTKPLLHREFFLQKLFEESETYRVRVHNMDKDIIIDLKQESLGIKRLTIVLCYMIQLQKTPDMCLCVDEIESGVFENILRNLILTINNLHVGQIIFTSHNMPLLDVLSRYDVIFVRCGRFDIPKTNNLCDEYFDYYRDNNLLIDETGVNALLDDVRGDRNV